MTIQTITKKVNKVLSTYAPGFNFNKAVIRINGRIHYLTEKQMRALQLSVLDMSNEEYQDFCKSVIIYNGKTVKRSTGTITIEKCGRLSSPFQEGFYDTDHKITLEMLKRQSRI